MAELKQRINDEVKNAMRSHDKPRVGVLRMILAALKQKEVDERIELDDNHIITILDKMVKQLKDSIEQFKAAGREDLVAKETYELEIVQSFLPNQLSEDEIMQVINEAIQGTGATSMKEMGQVMGIVKPRVQGRADMGKISSLVKEKLGQ